jgi:hypothetical protein
MLTITTAAGGGMDGQVGTTATHQAARASWMAPLLAVVFVMFARNIPNKTAIASLIIGGVAYLFYIVGFCCAVYALTTMRRTGRAGVLVPAIIGLLISGSLTLVFTLLIVNLLRR